MPIRRAALFAVFVSMLAAGQSAAQDVRPVLTSITPLGGRCGTTVEVAFNGTGLATAKALLFGHSGLSAKPAAAGRFAVTIAADVPEGDYDVWAVTPAGLSNPRRFAVGGTPEVAEKEPNDRPAAAQAVAFPVVVNGTLDPATDRDCFGFEAAAGRLVVVRFASETLDGTARAAVTVFDPAGREILHDDPHQAEPILAFRAPAAGAYVVRIEERGYRADPHNFYRLSISAGPVVTAAFPHVLTRGKTQPVTLYGYGLPGGKPAGAPFAAGLERLAVSIAAPADGEADGGGWLAAGAAPAAGFRHRHAGGATRFELADAEVARETDAPHNTPATAQAVTAPCDIAGRFAARGEVDWYRFAAKKGQSLWIEAVGERGGRAMDLDLTVHEAGDPRGKPLQAAGDTPQAKDQPAKLPTATPDPMAAWKVPADGEYLVMIRDLFGPVTAGAERSYRLLIGPRREAAAVVALHPDDAGPAGFAVPRGGTAALQLIAVRRNGHAGPIRVRAEGLPAGLTAAEAVIPASKLTGGMTFTAAADAAPWAGRLTLVCSTEIDGKPHTMPAVGATLVREGASAPVRRTDGIAAAVVEKAAVSKPPEKAPAVKKKK